MRDYILTPSEREIITEFLTTGKKLEGFRVLLYRVRKHNSQEVTNDEELIRQFLDKAVQK